MKKPKQVYKPEELKAPVGFDVKVGEDNGPYILITHKKTGSRGVMHPQHDQSTAFVQEELRRLAEKVRMADARNEQRREEKAAVAADQEEAETQKGRS